MQDPGRRPDELIKHLVNTHKNDLEEGSIDELLATLRGEKESRKAARKPIHEYALVKEDIPHARLDNSPRFRAQPQTGKPAAKPAPSPKTRGWMPEGSEESQHAPYLPSQKQTQPASQQPQRNAAWNERHTASKQPPCQPAPSTGWTGVGHRDGGGPPQIPQQMRHVQGPSQQARSSQGRVAFPPVPPGWREDDWYAQCMWDE